MNNKKYWLIAKAVLLILFVASVIASPSQDNTQLIWRTFMLIFLAVTFFYDLNDFRKRK
ncbi:MAG TPA: hypothetical protein PLY34_13340 [Ferruginibacter sp.]|nr:hypothetical protein [Ferruginibacter sp.]HPH90122.1 hypothetical protein [Ferruginibacter sp.]